MIALQSESFGNYCARIRPARVASGETLLAEPLGHLAFGPAWRLRSPSIILALSPSIRQATVVRERPVALPLDAAGLSARTIGSSLSATWSRSG